MLMFVYALMLPFRRLFYYFICRHSHFATRQFRLFDYTRLAPLRATPLTLLISMMLACHDSRCCLMMLFFMMPLRSQLFAFDAAARRCRASMLILFERRFFHAFDADISLRR